MNKKITVNSKDYNLNKEIDFNAICELEEYGLSLGNIKNSKMTSIRALLSFVADISPDEAGVEIMEHLKNGGSIADLAVLINYLTESDFFRTTRQPSEAEATSTSEDAAQA